MIGECDFDRMAGIGVARLRGDMRTQVFILDRKFVSGSILLSVLWSI